MKRMTKKRMDAILQITNRLVRAPFKKLFVDYDEEVDVLYLSFRRPQSATDADMRDDGIVVHKRGKESLA
jgi:hypothetical protein